MARTDNSSPGYYLSQTLALLAMIEDGQGGLSAGELARMVDISRASLKRYLVSAEANLGVEVLWDSKVGYTVSQWGLIDKRALMTKYHNGGFAAVIKS